MWLRFVIATYTYTSNALSVAMEPQAAPSLVVYSANDAVAIEPTTSMVYAKENGSLQKFVHDSCMQFASGGCERGLQYEPEFAYPFTLHLPGRAIPCCTVRFTMHTSTVQYGTV